jgi:hypothetical protein
MSPRWPEPKKGIPEGHYTFTLVEEPELHKNERGSLRLAFVFTAMPGNIQHKESFFPWEDRYEDLCKVLGVEHGKDIRMEGASFDGDVVYEPAQNDPKKVYARIRNIRPAGEFVPKTGTEDGDIPF